MRGEKNCSLLNPREMDVSHLELQFAFKAFWQTLVCYIEDYVINEHIPSFPYFSGEINFELVVKPETYKFLLTCVPAFFGVV